MTVQLQSGTPLAEQLSASVQQKIVEIGWSSDGEDASPLSEYIVLMLVNGKTESQITAELSGDLLGLGPEDESVKVFTSWMFSELARLSRELGAENGTASIGVVDGQEGSRPDEDMADDSHEALEGVPTGPKAMRHQNQNQNQNQNQIQKQRRPGGLYNQIQKNMDRSSDPLRRVPNNRGGDQFRIQKHDTQRGGPRQNFNGPQGGPMNQRHMGRGQQGGHMQSTYMNAMSNPNMAQQGQFGPMMMSPEQQFQFLQMMEQQARMMGMIGPNGFMGGPGSIPGQEQQQQPGRSLFDRVDNTPKNNNHHNKPRQQQQQQQQQQPAAGGDTEMGDGAEGLGEDVAGQEDVACKFGLRCTKSDCVFAHQSPVSDPSRPVAFSGEKCAFGISCKNKKCTSAHPSPASGGSKPQQAFEQQDCKFWPNCKNPHCPFKHPANATMPPCRFGAACTKPNCPFTHNPQTLDVPCKFKPCLNPHCSFKHEEGQQAGIFENKIWTPKAHVSDRKFVTDEEGDEELIIPGQTSSSGSSNVAPATAASSSQIIAAGGELGSDI
ncbi:hypothetical protein TWF192_000170 [Orbilia oligospora]|uniref:C3H1-type domain-containing protein n=1 Tax=Orbilia oligospora TaxID=2813651 RepID=A0A6G1MP21_ORBOL|nr:hypothetical protein TWF679_008905 [Orbilia oligospora]KAF3231271.1 hypothetical protein TWF191_006762 [Orbilia oligospora]KAF3265520.1 hypothetical protein TWF192_000170 [Orbilia oligospora]